MEAKAAIIGHHGYEVDALLLLLLLLQLLMMPLLSSLTPHVNSNRDGASSVLSTELGRHS